MTVLPIHGRATVFTSGGAIVRRARGIGQHGGGAAGSHGGGGAGSAAAAGAAVGRGAGPMPAPSATSAMMAQRGAGGQGIPQGSGISHRTGRHFFFGGQLFPSYGYPYWQYYYPQQQYGYQAGGFNLDPLSLVLGLALGLALAR